MTELVQTAGMYAIIIIAAVEAIRSRIPTIDGPWELALAAGCSVAIAALFLPVTTRPDVLYAGRIAALAWLVAVGGDRWLSKVAKLAAKKS